MLTDASPYGSRRLTVETDGVTTAAYLRDVRDTVIGAAWIANHQPASPGLDLSRLNAGLAPVMPSTRTLHPEGQSALDPKSLQVVWFEEGDGAAVLESGAPLCVIPVWSDMSRGIPGYSRYATAQGPFAFPLAEEIEEFEPRIRQAQGFWEWCRTEGAWAGFQQSALGHLLSRLGPGGHYWHDVGRQFRGSAGGSPGGAEGEGAGGPSGGPANGSRGGGSGSRSAGRGFVGRSGGGGAAGRSGGGGPVGRLGGSGSGGGSSNGPSAAGGQERDASPAPLVGVSERPARTGREFSVLSTLGMSCQRMPTVELYEDDVSHYARIELAVASTLPSQRAGSIFPWLAQYPWRSVTWFAPGDVVKWYHEPQTFPLNKGPLEGAGGPDARWAGVLLLDDPSRLAGPAAPDLSGFMFGGDPVRWLWLVPITDEERLYAKSEGSNALVRRLREEGRSWVVS